MACPLIAGTREKGEQATVKERAFELDETVVRRRHYADGNELIVPVNFDRHGKLDVVLEMALMG